VTKQEMVRRLKKAYEAEYYFPGVLGNPEVFASRWGLHPARTGSISNRQKIQVVPPPSQSQTIVARESVKPEWIRIYTGDSVSIHTSGRKHGKSYDQIITGVVVGATGRTVKQKLVVRKSIKGGNILVRAAVGRISKIKVKRRTANHGGYFLRVGLP
jgi:ribosomal protein L19